MPFLCRDVCVVYTHLNCPPDTSLTSAISGPTHSMPEPCPKARPPLPGSRLQCAAGAKSFWNPSGTRGRWEAVPHSQKGPQ